MKIIFWHQPLLGRHSVSYAHRVKRRFLPVAGGDAEPVGRDEACIILIWRRLSICPNGLQMPQVQSIQINCFIPKSLPCSGGPSPIPTAPGPIIGELSCRYPSWVRLGRIFLHRWIDWCRLHPSKEATERLSRCGLGHQCWSGIIAECWKNWPWFGRFCHW